VLGGKKTAVFMCGSMVKSSFVMWLYTVGGSEQNANISKPPAQAYQTNSHWKKWEK
jgi:hypothetical protein